jgi:hypothetical protein
VARQLLFFNGYNQNSLLGFFEIFSYFAELNKARYKK